MPRIDIDHEIIYNDTLTMSGSDEESEVILVIRASDVAGYYSHERGDNQRELVDKMLGQSRIQKQLADIDPEYLRRHLNFGGAEKRASNDFTENLRHFLGLMLEDLRCNIEESGVHGYPTRPLKIKGLH